MQLLCEKCFSYDGGFLFLAPYDLPSDSDVRNIPQNRSEGTSLLHRTKVVHR